MSAAPAAAPERLRRLDVASMLTREPPPIPWDVEPLLIPGELTILVGREGRGKSMLSQLIGMAVSDPGCIDVPGLTFSSLSRRVLVVDAENGEHLIHRRLHSAGLRDARDYVVYEAVALDLRRPEDLSDLEATIQREVAGVVVLDSLATLAPGIPENEADRMAPFMLGLQRVARETGAAILLLHHASRRDGGAQYRGSTAIGAAVSIEVAMIAHEGDPDPQRRELRWGKVRPIPRPDPVWLRIDSDGGQLAIAPAEPFAAADDGPAPQLAHVAERMSAEVQRGERAWKDLCAAVPVGPDSGTAKRAVALAVERGWIVRVSRGRYAAGDTAQPAEESVRPPLEGMARPDRSSGQLGPMAGPRPEGEMR